MSSAIREVVPFNEEETIADLKARYEQCFNPATGRRNIPEELKEEIVDLAKHSKLTRRDLAAKIGIKFANDISVWKRKFTEQQPKRRARKVAPSVPLHEVAARPEIRALKEKYNALEDKGKDSKHVPQDLAKEIIIQYYDSGLVLQDFASIVNIKRPSDIMKWQKNISNNNAVNFDYADTRQDWVGMAKNMELDELVVNFRKLKSYLVERIESENEKINSLKNDVLQ